MKTAFTLIELLIVVAIIGILAAIAVPNFLNAQMKAKIARCVSNMKSCGQALEMYYLDNNTYPQDAHDGWGNPAGHYAGFRALTTPVSYIAFSAMQNPFTSGYQNKLRDTTDGRELDPMFELGTYRKRTNSENEILFQLNNFPTNIWLLESSGPDLGDDYATTNYPLTRPLIYHPSNGLVTKGDIYHGGGVYIAEWVRMGLSY